MPEPRGLTNQTICRFDGLGLWGAGLARHNVHSKKKGDPQAAPLDTRKTLGFATFRATL